MHLTVFAVGILLVSATVSAESASDRLKGCPRGEIYAHPKECTQFLTCAHGVVREMECPSGLHFHPGANICNYPKIANCKKSEEEKSDVEVPVIPDNEQPNIETEEIPDKRFCLASRGQFPHPTDCRKYYNCWDGNVAVGTCPVGTNFDPAKRYCIHGTGCIVKQIHYKDSGSRQSVKLFLSLQRTVQDVPEFDDDIYTKGVRITGHKCPMARGQFAHETNCQMFYNCWDEVVLLQKCPHGLLFDPVKRICDSPNRVNCHGQFIPDKDKEEETPKVKCNIDEGLMPKVDDCRKFYICFQGLGSEFTCPSNLMFDVKVMACGYPGEVTCAGSPIEKVTEVPVVEPTNKIVTEPTKVVTTCSQRADGVYDTSECGAFVKCVAGRAYTYKCPANLVYNPIKIQCDYSHNVPRCSNA